MPLEGTDSLDLEVSIYIRTLLLIKFVSHSKENDKALLIPKVIEGAYGERSGNSVGTKITRGLVVSLLFINGYMYI